MLAEGELVDPDFEADESSTRPLARAGQDARSGDGSIAKYDPLQAYMREVQRHALLTQDEEHDLATRYVKTGTCDAAARLVTANLRLVVKIAYEYRRAYKNIMDLIQEGNIGLMQAVKRYDPYRGVKLSSYAAWWIRAYILRFILNNWRLVKLGTTQAQRKLFFNLNKEKARLSADGHRAHAGGDRQAARRGREGRHRDGPAPLARRRLARRARGRRRGPLQRRAGRAALVRVTGARRRIRRAPS